jgi:hypothetical protein
MYRFAKVRAINNGVVISRGSGVSTTAILLCVLLFAIMSGMRWGVGTDYFSYLDVYNRNSEIIEMSELEGGWKIISEFMMNNGFHYAFYFGFWAALQVFFICLVFKKKSKAFPYAALLCVMGSYYLSMMNGIRQSLVCCSFVWAASFISNKKIIPFILWLLIAVTFHQSALIVAPLFLFAFDKSIWNNKWVLLGVFIASIIIGYTSIVSNLINSAQKVLFLLQYDSYAENIDQQFDLANFTEAAWGPSRISSLVLNLMLVYLYPRVEAHFKDNYFKLAFKFFYIGICFTNIIINSNRLFLRPLWYLNFFGLPVSAFTLAYLKQCGRKEHLNYLLLLFLAIIPIYVSCVKDYYNPLNSEALYQFFFDSDKINLRRL